MNNTQQEFSALDFLFLMSFYININNMEHQRQINHMLEEDDQKINTIISNQNTIIENQQKILEYIEKGRL